MHRYSITTMAGNGSSVTSTHYATSRTDAAQQGKARFLEVWNRPARTVLVNDLGPGQPQTHPFQAFARIEMSA